ncbi:MAG: hypothetical protein F4X98_03730 [Gammaproteobacteria bacterium]|nr:hypothetical protein [Gammaproteobacteria bacterium]
MDKALDRTLEDWRADPTDADTIASMRAAFLVLQAISEHSHGNAADQLARSVANLLDRLHDGTVDPTPEAVSLVAEAVSHLPGIDDEVESEVSGPSASLVERIDAFASGLAGVPIEADSSPAGDPSDPPLLTVRHDGVRVTPGSFDSIPTSTAPTAAVPAALAAVADQLRFLIDTLTTMADGDPDPDEIEHLARRLAATADLVQRLKSVVSGP